jgi:hypothetical protein
MTDKKPCNHEKSPNDIVATQYRCIKCGEWISECYFYDKDKK